MVDLPFVAEEGTDVAAKEEEITEAAPAEKAEGTVLDGLMTSTSSASDT